MPYRIAGIDVIKGCWRWSCPTSKLTASTSLTAPVWQAIPAQLRLLADWLLEQQVEEVVMESTRSIGNRCGEHWNGTGSRSARSGKAPARCRSTASGAGAVDRGRRGRKNDFADADVW